MAPVAQQDKARGFYPQDCGFDSRRGLCALVAQLDRAPGSYLGECGFNSRRAHHGALAQQQSAGPTNRRSLGQHQHALPADRSSEVEHPADNRETGGSSPPDPTVEEWPSGRWHPVRTRKVERPVGPNPTSSSERCPSGYGARLEAGCG